MWRWKPMGVWLDESDNNELWICIGQVIDAGRKQANLPAHLWDGGCISGKAQGKIEIITSTINAQVVTFFHW